MKHLFSMFALLSTATLVFAQTATLELTIEAEGASEETVLVISLMIETSGTQIDTLVTLFGPEDQFDIPVPADAMQGTVNALTESCEYDSIFAFAAIELEEQNAMGMYSLVAELELPYCDDDEDDDADDEDDAELDLDEVEFDALYQYLDSLCGSNADIDGMYCGLLENLIACLDNDSVACDDIAQWLDDVEWVWQGDEDDNEDDEDDEDDNDDDEDDNDDDDEDEDEECDASLLVVQAFDADSNAIANALFVYVLGYDEDNNFYWNFGTEGPPSTDPLPTWEYETDGPYQLCLTVTGGDGSCIDTSCVWVSVDSLGWFDGIQGGFTITALPGDPGMVSSVNSPEHPLEIPVIYPNPSVHGELSIQWNSHQAGLVEVEVLDLTGKVVFRHQHACASGAQNLRLTPDVGAGLHLVRLTQEGIQRTVKWLVH